MLIPVSRDDDFPRSRKTDGKHGINPWKRKTYFQTEKHGNVLLPTCCTEICNKSYQIQRKKNDFAFIHAVKSIAEWYRPSHASCHVHVTLPWPYLYTALSARRLVRLLWPGHACMHGSLRATQQCKQTGLAIVHESSQRAIQARHSRSM